MEVGILFLPKRLFLRSYYPWGSVSLGQVEWRRWWNSCLGISSHLFIFCRRILLEILFNAIRLHHLKSWCCAILEFILEYHLLSIWKFLLDSVSPKDIPKQRQITFFPSTHGVTSIYGREKMEYKFQFSQAGNLLFFFFPPLDWNQNHILLSWYPDDDDEQSSPRKQSDPRSITCQRLAWLNKHDISTWILLFLQQ